MFDFFLFIIDADWYPCRIFVVLRLGVMLLDLGIRLEEDTWAYNSASKAGVDAFEEWGLYREDDHKTC